MLAAKLAECPHADPFVEPPPAPVRTYVYVPGPPVPLTWGDRVEIVLEWMDDLGPWLFVAFMTLLSVAQSR